MSLAANAGEGSLAPSTGRNSLDNKNIETVPSTRIRPEIGALRRLIIGPQAL